MSQSRTLRSNPTSSADDSDPDKSIALSLSTILSTLGRMEPELHDLKLDVAKWKEDQTKKITNITRDIDDIRVDMINIKETNSKLVNTNKNLQDKITKMECYSRRNNLIFMNIDENERPLSKTIRAVWSRMGVSNPDDIMIDDIHRLGYSIRDKPRPIIVRFSLNIFIQQSESIGQQGKPYLKASGSEIVYSATYKQNYNKKVNK